MTSSIFDSSASGRKLSPRDVRDAYRQAPRRARLHVAGRWRSCPFAAVEAQVPARGRVLDLGCGHGLFSLYLAMTGPERTVTGSDVDHDKIDIARQAAEAAHIGNVDFEVVDPDEQPAGEWDAITFVDVLYLLGEESARQLVRAAATTLAPGGVLLVKEMDVRPRWKYEWNRFQELVATRVARITQGEHVQVVPPELISSDLEAAGLVVERHRLDRRSLHPHHLIVARRPA